MLSQCPGKRAGHCYRKKIKALMDKAISSQCPGKRAGHCYTSHVRFFAICGGCLNALESGRVIVTAVASASDLDIEELSQCPGKRAGHCYRTMRMSSGQSLTVSMPWKAGGSLLRVMLY